MKAYVRYHDDAMEAYDRYEAAAKAGRFAAASRALLEALRLEAEAASKVPVDLEPTRSVLFRSAAAIALDAGRAAEAKRLVIEGLRGKPPREIEGELLELLDDACSRGEPRAVLDQLEPGTVIQDLTVHGDGLSMAVVTRIHDAWLGYYESSLEQALGESEPEEHRLEAVHAGVGSFKLQLKVSGQLDHDGRRVALDVVRTLGDFLRAQLDRSDAAEAERSLARLTPLVALLTMLKQERARLDVRMHVVGNHPDAGRDDVELFITPPSKPLLLSLQQRAATMHLDSEDVPQANLLDRVFQLVEHVLHNGVLPTADELDVDKRQVNYYRRAAEILGYLSDDRSGLPTPAATYVARASGHARLRHALQRFEASRVGTAWITWSNGARLCDVERDSAEAFLSERAVGLSPSTVRRRAKTLVAWYDAFAAVFDAEQDP